MPRRQPPSAPASPRLAGSGQPAAARTNPAVAARLRQLAAQAEHRRAVAEFRARHAADQQARINALLLEAIAALASLPSGPDHPGNRPA
jgi:hypothetical protein